MSYRKNNSLGMTLIELMFALVLSMLILCGLSAVYLSIAQNHLAEEALQNIQENSRMTLQYLGFELRTAGHVGCATLNKNRVMTGSSNYLITAENRLQPYYGKEIKENSAAFTVRYASPLTHQLTERMHEINKLQVTANNKINMGDVLLISDCQTVDIFQVKSIYSINQQVQQIESETNLSKLYQADAEVSALEIKTFYIGKTNRKDSTGKEIYALYVKDINDQKLELVEGVTDMDVHYDILENNALVEHTAAEIHQWSQVVGVSLQVMFAPLNNFLLHKKEYYDVALREV